MLTARVFKKLSSRAARQLRCKSSLSPQEKNPSSFLWDAPQEFWSSLRRQAATALTSSLSPDEQQDLLAKLGHSTKAAPEVPAVTKDEKQEDYDSLFVQKSIAEAVAEARLQEAAMQSKKWDQEREKIMQDAKKAAQQQVETELRIQKFQKWQSEVQQAQLTSMETNASEETADALETPESDAHPILGHALVDLGYKRVHVVSAKQLATIQVWKKQRIYRHNRSKTMAQDKLKTLHLGMPGVIGLHEVRSFDLECSPASVTENVADTTYFLLFLTSRLSGQRRTVVNHRWSAPCWNDVDSRETRC